ncbi:MAG: hypothetical protein KGN84_13160 [Acidobacteriota bacterium]|nr:hypothetical protein [Acidobacteriota bacterium]
MMPDHFPLLVLINAALAVGLVLLPKVVPAAADERARERTERVLKLMLAGVCLLLMSLNFALGFGSLQEVSLFSWAVHVSRSAFFTSGVAYGVCGLTLLSSLRGSK